MMTMMEGLVEMRSTDYQEESEENTMVFKTLP